VIETWTSWWTQASEIDPTITLGSGTSRLLNRKWLVPERYSRRKLFTAMARQGPIVFDDFPLRARMDPFFFDGTNPAARLRLLVNAERKTLTKSGPCQRRSYRPVSEVIDRWERDRSVLSANDIFFRHLRFDRAFDCSALSDFNVIPLGPQRIQDLEVATFLVGTQGCMTDSHSDDPDGSNYCIAGRKLWMVWDRAEGQANGIQDCEYDAVFEHAHFDLETFLGLRSARWFTMSRGQTLFLPGNHTHKVLTLERYMGISSFYFAIPNALSSVTRWIVGGTTMVNQDHREELVDLLIKRIDAATTGDRALRHRWGFEYRSVAYDHWLDTWDENARMVLGKDPSFARLLGRIHPTTRERA